MILRSILSLLLILTPLSSWAVSETATIEMIGRIHQKISLGASQPACGAPQAQNCLFENYCGTFDNKTQEAYLYKNAEGRTFPNHLLLYFSRQSELCVAKDIYPQPALKDPFSFPELLKRPDAEVKKLYGDALQRTSQVFSEAKDRVVRILKSRRTSANAVEIDNMVRRVSAIRFKAPNTTGDFEDLPGIGCDLPNAFYSPATHEVVVCPQVMNMPEPSLLATFAHELTHSIDPCQSTKDYSQTGSQVSEADAGSKQQIFSKGIPLNRNPFGSVIQCLQTPASLPVKIPSKMSLVKDLNDQLVSVTGLKSELASTDENGADSPEFEAIREMHQEQLKELDANYVTKKYCMSVTNNGHMGEAFSDWMSSQTISQKIQETQDSSKAKQIAFESQGVFLSMMCPNVRASAVASLRPYIRDKKDCENMLGTMSNADSINDETNSHPSTSKRISRIAYAGPTIQKALGCKPDPNVKECK